MRTFEGCIEDTWIVCALWLGRDGHQWRQEIWWLYLSETEVEDENHHFCSHGEHGLLLGIMGLPVLVIRTFSVLVDSPISRLFASRNHWGIHSFYFLWISTKCWHFTRLWAMKVWSVQYSVRAVIGSLLPLIKPENFTLFLSRWISLVDTYYMGQSTFLCSVIADLSLQCLSWFDVDFKLS